MFNIKCGVVNSCLKIEIAKSHISIYLKMDRFMEFVNADQTF